MQNGLYRMWAVFRHKNIASNSRIAIEHKTSNGLRINIKYCNLRHRRGARRAAHRRGQTHQRKTREQDAPRARATDGDDDDDDAR